MILQLFRLPDDRKLFGFEVFGVGGRERGA
jgi:hypothetical protein